MSEFDNFVDQAKSQVLYTQQSDDAVSAMLSFGKVNKRLTGNFIKWTAMVRSFSVVWRGRYLDRLNDLIEYMERQTLCEDGYSRKQAIEIKGEGVREEKAKKMGVLGL